MSESVWIIGLDKSKLSFFSTFGAVVILAAYLGEILPLEVDLLRLLVFAVFVFGKPNDFFPPSAPRLFEVSCSLEAQTL